MYHDNNSAEMKVGLCSSARMRVWPTACQIRDGGFLKCQETGGRGNRKSGARMSSQCALYMTAVANRAGN